MCQGWSEFSTGANDGIPKESNPMTMQFPSPAWTGTTTLVVNGNSTGNTIIDLNDPWSVDVNIHVDDPSNTFAGAWEVHLFVESMGPGPEVSVAAPVLVAAAPGTRDYTATFPIAGNSPVLSGPPAISSVYKLISVIEHRNTLGAETTVSGVIEGPLVYLRNP
jgi:hypothetical protein